MLDYNLEYIKAFYFTAQLGSVTKAANALYLTQPAVSHSIQMLEKQFQIRLFIRTPKGVKLTKEGEVFYQHVNSAFSSLMTGEKTLRRLADFEIGTLNIAATETAIYNYLLPKIEKFKEMYPQVRINIAGSSTDETLRMLRAGDADIAFAVSPVPEQESFNMKPLQSFRDIFIAGRKFAYLEDRVMTLEEISRLPLVTVEKGTSARGHIDRWFEEEGILLDPDYSVRTSSTVLYFVEQNLAVGIIPTMFAREPIEKGTVFEVKAEREIPPREIMIIYHKEDQLTLLCRRFLEFLMDQ